MVNKRRKANNLQPEKKRNSLLAVSLIMLATILVVLVFVFFIGFKPRFGSVSTGKAAALSQCTDSDNGLNYSVKGTVKIGDSVVGTDFCDANHFLLEYYCDGNNWYVDSHPCPRDCIDGKCYDDTLRIVTLAGEGINSDAGGTRSLAEIRKFHTRVVGVMNHIDADLIVTPEYTYYLDESLVKVNCTSILDNCTITSNDDVSNMIKEIQSLAASKKINIVLSSIHVEINGTFLPADGVAFIINSIGNIQTIKLKGPQDAKPVTLLTKKGKPFSTYTVICLEISDGDPGRDNYAQTLFQEKGYGPVDVFIHTSHGGGYSPCAIYYPPDTCYDVMKRVENGTINYARVSQVGTPHKTLGQNLTVTGPGWNFMFKDTTLLVRSEDSKTNSFAMDHIFDVNLRNLTRVGAGSARRAWGTSEDKASCTDAACLDYTFADIDFSNVKSCNPSGGECSSAGLPSGFIPTAGYYQGYGGGRVHLWSGNQLYIFDPSNAANGFRLMDSSNMGALGLSGFVAKTGFFYNFSNGENKLMLFNASATIMQYSPSEKKFSDWTAWWRQNFMAALPANFRPVVAYAHPLSGGRVNIFDSDGNLYIYPNSSQQYFKVTADGMAALGLSGFKPVVGYYYKSGSADRIELWDSSGFLKAYNGSMFLTKDSVYKASLGLPANFAPTIGYSWKNVTGNYVIDLWMGSDVYRSTNGGTSYQKVIIH